MPANVRRRQAADADGSGIFVLSGPTPTSPLSGSGSFSPRFNQRQRRNRGGRSIMSILYGTFAIASVYLLLKMQPSANLSYAYSDAGTNIPPHDSNNNTVQLDKQVVTEEEVAIPFNPPPAMIPKRLIFTYQYNLIDPSPEDPPFDADDPLTANVLNTISAYEQYWNVSMRYWNVTDLEPQHRVVSFLSDNDCMVLLRNVEPRLVKHFYQERKGDFRADLCRMAELYLHGGHYFDIDTKLIDVPPTLEAFDIPPVIPDPLWQLRHMKEGKKRTVATEGDIVTFATVYNQEGRFFNGYMAATPRHPILNKTFEYMVAYYKGNLMETLPTSFVERYQKVNIDEFPSRRRPGPNSVGPYALSLANQITSNEEWEQYVRDLMNDQDNISAYELEKLSTKNIPANRRYSRFLYEVLLDDELVLELDFFTNVTRQDAEYTRKRNWCNEICFARDKAYFYSRVAGSQVCPTEAKLDELHEHGHDSDNFADGRNYEPIDPNDY